jgi:hypothetical protein
MKELESGCARAVTVTGAHTFLIPDDARGYGAFGGGYCQELPRKRSLSFRTLADELQQPTLAGDGSAAGGGACTAAQMHSAFQALYAFEVCPCDDACVACLLNLRPRRRC